MTDAGAGPNRGRWLHWVLLVTWIAAFAATHIPAERVPTLHASDKTLHFLGYAALATILWLTLASRGLQTRRRVAMVITLLALYAAFDETTQPLVNRAASIHDWAADCLGAAAATVVAEIVAVVRGSKPSE